MSTLRQKDASAIDWVEEAVHLLRRAPIEVFAFYYAGTVPFAVGLLFFWAHTTWFLPSGAEVAWGALGLTALFAVMKVFQAEFCARLMAFRLGEPAPAWSWRRLGTIGVSQLEVQPWALLATGVASILVVPLGWVYAYGQVATVIGSDEHLHRSSGIMARLWPATNHGALLLFSGLALCVWGNLLAAFIAIPWLANRVLGIENVFGWSGWSFGNSTFLAAVTAVTWLVVDPVVKAFYTLWVFYARSRRTGDDIRLELQRAAGAGRSRAARVALLLVVAAAAASGIPTVRADSQPSREVVHRERLDEAIDRVLDKPEFSWRLRPVAKPEAKAAGGPFRRFLQKGANLVKDGFRWIGRKIRNAVDWVIHRLFPDRSGAGAPASATAIGLVKLLLYGLLCAAIILLGWVVWVVMSQTRQQARSVVAANAVVPAAPDLRDENIQVAQLPSEGWIALAREQIARGEWRLALRALYLAMLAQLAAEGLISFARFKTNLDYERELRRRALSRAELVSGFVARRRAFEAVWYGREVVMERQVREWMAELERRVSP